MRESQMNTAQERHKEKMRAKAEGRWRPATRHPSDILAALLRMCSDCAEPPDSSARAVFLTEGGKPHPAAVALGWDLWRAGGTHYMRSAIKEIPAYDRGELDHAWDGIGADHDRWRC